MYKTYYVYILTNKNNKVLYTGITSDLKKRIYEHKHELVEGFTKKYNLHKLVYSESCNDVNSAIEREKQIKSWPRRKKIQLIETINPGWNDIYEDL